MFRIALIQNQSEMAHYGYADARPLLADFGYDATLYTADNVDSLGAALIRNQFDAVVFASNALNDKTILAETALLEFRRAFCEWLQNGRGCLCLHQLRLATHEDPALGFLPPPLDSISAVVRPSTEKSADGTVDYGSTASNHILLLYPHDVKPCAVQQNAIGFRSLPGVYWHSWSNVNLAEWEELLVDPSAKGGPRPLLVSAREPRSFRVVASALTLDWQKQRQLLQNILTYVVEGRHNTAVLLDEGNRNMAFDYLIGRLQSRKFPFKQYLVGQDHTALVGHINKGVHSVLLLGPFVAFNRLQEELRSAAINRITSGNLKLITTEKQEPFRQFSVAGRERLALRLLQDVELRVQAELRVGYIDASFWSTAETLQTLEALPQTTAKYDNVVQTSLSLMNEHDRDGSYDEVFGASCAFLWMRGRFLGKQAQETKATAAWIRSRIDKYEAREQALAYLTLAELDLLEDAEKEALRGLLTNLDAKRLSEIDLVVYLRVALVSSETTVLPTLVAALEKKQYGGAWVDLATTATAVATLVESLGKLRGADATYPSLKPVIERMVFGGIIHIQEAHEGSLVTGGNTGYPWDGKASTTAKCIQAWLRFEELVDLPVQELMDALEGYHGDATAFFAGRQALSVLEDLKRQGAGLRKELSGQAVELSRERKAREQAQRKATRVFYVRLSLVIVTYAFLTVLVATIFQGGISQLGAVLKAAFVDRWGFHFAFVSVLAAYLILPWKKWIWGEDAAE